jgi:uncharacterized protein (TIGR04255 family)
VSSIASQSGFKPVHAAHAIEQLIVAVQFEAQLSDDAIIAVNEVMAQFADDLPVRNDIRGMGFQIGPNGVAPIAHAINDRPDGVVRSRFNERGVQIKELRIDRQSLVFRTLLYTRWDAVWGETQRYFNKILQKLEGCNIGSYGLTYVDKFIWQGAAAACKPLLLLRDDSPHVAAKCLTAQDLWHCHSGMFTRASNHIKRLEVVDLDCVDELNEQVGFGSPSQRIVRISINVVDILNQLGHDTRVISGTAAIKELSRGFSELHDVQKRVASEIFTEETAVSIGLIVNEP